MTCCTVLGTMYQQESPNWAKQIPQSYTIAYPTVRTTKKLSSRTLHVFHSTLFEWLWNRDSRFPTTWPRWNGLLAFWIPSCLLATPTDWRRMWWWLSSPSWMRWAKVGCRAAVSPGSGRIGRSTPWRHQLANQDVCQFEGIWRPFFVHWRSMNYQCLFKS